MTFSLFIYSYAVLLIQVLPAEVLYDTFGINKVVKLKVRSQGSDILKGEKVFWVIIVHVIV